MTVLDGVGRLDVKLYTPSYYESIVWIFHFGRFGRGGGYLGGGVRISESTSTPLGDRSVMWVTMYKSICGEGQE